MTVRGRISASGGLTLAILAAGTLACADRARVREGHTVRDSAGIRIVESGAPAWTEESRWRLSDAPGLEIGVLEGAPEYQLFDARDAHRLSDGGVVVANSGTFELRYYDAEGRHRVTAGGEGGGPGEFEDLTALLPLPGDTIAAYDRSHQRISVFGPDGRFLGSSQLSAPDDPASARPVRRRADGSWDVVHRMRLMRPEEGAYRDTLLYVHHRADGALGDTLGKFPGTENFIHSSSSTGRRIVTMGPIGFGRFTSIAPRAGGYVAGTSDRYELRAYDLDGRPEMIMRRADSLRSVTARDIEETKASVLERTDERQKAWARDWFAALPFAETLPAFARAIEVDPEGNLWVPEFPFPADEPRTWSVFGPSGAWLGDLTMPSGFTLVEAGGDYVLGRWRDDLDVEHIRVYGLIKR